MRPAVFRRPAARLLRCPHRALTLAPERRRRCGAAAFGWCGRQLGVGGGDGGHRHLDQLAAAAAQRFGHCQRGVKTRQRVGDGVAAEHRPVVAAADQPAGHRGVVAERHPVGALALGAVTGDAQPHPTVARARRRRAETRGGPAPRGATTRSPHRRRRAASCIRAGSSKSTAYESFPPFIQSKNAGGPARVPSGRARALDLDDGGAGLRQQLPTQRAGPHRRQVGDQQTGRAARRRWPRPAACTRGGAAGVSPRAATGRPSSRARSVTSAAVAAGNPVLHGRPRIVADASDSTSAGTASTSSGRDSVSAHQPSLLAQQPRGPARRDPAVRGAGPSSAARPVRISAGVDGHAGESTEFVGHPPAPATARRREYPTTSHSALSSPTE